MADLNESVKLAEERTEHAIADREKFAMKNQENVLKLNSMKDEIQDKNLQLEEFEARISLLEHENKIISEGRDAV